MNEKLRKLLSVIEDYKKSENDNQDNLIAHLKTFESNIVVDCIAELDILRFRYSIHSDVYSKMEFGGVQHSIDALKRKYDIK